MRWIRQVFAPRAKPPMLGEPNAWDGKPVEDVDMYWASAWSELLARQSVLAKDLRLSNADWAVDQAAGLIQFERSDGSLVAAPVQIIGSWNPKTDLFTWGWDHPSVQTRLRAGAERTRWFGDKHGLRDLVDPKLKTTEGYAWRLTAMAMKINGAAGAYRGPTEDGPVVFMTLGDLKILGGPPPPKTDA